MRIVGEHETGLAVYKSSYATVSSSSAVERELTNEVDRIGIYSRFTEVANRPMNV